MSGAIRAIGRVFRSIGHAIQQIVKSPVFKFIAIAAATYFTAGLASAAFADPLVAASAAGEATSATGAVLDMTTVTETGMSVGDVAGASAADAAAAGGAIDAGVAATDAATTAAEVPGAASDAGLQTSANASAQGAADAAAGPASLAPTATPTPGVDPTTGVPINSDPTSLANNGIDASTGAPATTSTVGSPDAISMASQNAAESGGTLGVDANSAGIGTSQYIPTTPPGQGIVQNVMSAGKQFLSRIGDYSQTPGGMTLIGNAALGLGKGYLDARSLQAQQDFQAQQRARYTAVPNYAGMYRYGNAGKGVVARAMGPTTSNSGSGG